MTQVFVSTKDVKGAVCKPVHTVDTLQAPA
jgi:hypothetical protein